MAPRPTPGARIAALLRSDKWQLGNLDSTVWAPTSPVALDRPGFWDPIHLLHWEVGPGFTVALLDERWGELALRRDHRAGSLGHWEPGTLITRWRSRIGEATEQRRVLPGTVLESCWAFPHAIRSAWLVAYTALPTESIARVVADDAAGLSFQRTVRDRHGQTLTLDTQLTVSPGKDSRVLHGYCQAPPTPEWRCSPFAHGGADLAGTVPAPAPTPEGAHTTWLGVARKVTHPDRLVTVRMTARPPRSVLRPASERRVPTWKSHFGSFPAFRCGDRRLDRYFDYRIYGLGLHRVGGGWHNVPCPAVAEGPAYFHVPITYSAQCHMFEMRWGGDGREAWGSLLNFLHNQKPDGSLHGRLYGSHLVRSDFYHANWGDALLAVHRMHPRPDLLARCYEGLSRYAQWLVAARDREGSGMFTVANHFETGQEYMSRYMVADDQADVDGWDATLGLKGIDVTVYAYLLFRALETIADELGRPNDGPGWRALAHRTARAISAAMWSPDDGIFTDAVRRGARSGASGADGDPSPAPATWAPTGVKAAVGFYPLLTDLPTPAQVESMLDHLENPRTFGSPYPVPSSSMDDPRFSAEGVWRGVRRNCPWNGRVWPMTTSHVIEGLIRCWRRGNRRAGKLAARFLDRYVKMMFHGGKARRPNCFEHYHPVTGTACHYRRVDDYQHSWVIDLMAKALAGIHFGASSLIVHPVPHDRATVRLGPVRARGVAFEVDIAEDQATVTTTDQREFSGPRDAPLSIRYEELA